MGDYSPYALIQDHYPGHELRVIRNNPRKDAMYESILRQLFPEKKFEIPNEYFDDEIELYEEPSPNAPFPEAHECHVFNCGSLDCPSCEQSIACENCDICGINNQIHQPCLACSDPKIHSVAKHRASRCAFHKDSPVQVTSQFTVKTKDEVLIGKFADPDPTRNIIQLSPLPDKVPKSDFEIPSNIRMPTACDCSTGKVAIEEDDAQPSRSPEHGVVFDDSLISQFESETFCDECNCADSDSELCVFPFPHKKGETDCPKKHHPQCKCYSRKPPDRNPFLALAHDVVLANHAHGCLDPDCAVRHRATEIEDSFFFWSSPHATTNFTCPLNSAINRSKDHDKNSAFIVNYIPGGPSLQKMGYMPHLSFWDRLNYFSEEFDDMVMSYLTPMISAYNATMLMDRDPDVTGRYDDAFTFWDRNKVFTTKKILVKKPETLIRVSQTDNVPLKFEALTALYKAARQNSSIQENMGNPRPVTHFLQILDESNHDGIRRMAAYNLALATSHPLGRCTFFSLGPQVVKNIFDHYLNDKLYEMRRVYMLVLSNLMEDNGVCSMTCHAISFENTFKNMCCPDSDLQSYLLKTIYYAMQDIDGRDKIKSLPEFELTPVLACCLNRKKIVQERALNLLDALVSFCKQEFFINQSSKERGFTILNNLLRKGYMVYSHPVVLKAYEELAENPGNATALKEGSLHYLLEFVNTVDDPKLIANTLNVLIKMARDPFTQEVLALTNVLTKIAPYIVHTNEDLAQATLKIVELMASKGVRTSTTQQLVLADPMVDLLWVVGNENRGWDTRAIALRCITALLNLDPYFSEVYIRCKNATVPIELLCHQSKYLTSYSKTLLVQVLSALAKSNRYYEFLIRNKAVKALVYSFKNFEGFESQLYSHSVGLLAYMMKDRRAVVQFSNIKNSYDSVSKKFMERKFITADILMNLMFLVTDLCEGFQEAVVAFLRNGFFKWMVDLVDTYPELSCIKTAVDCMIRNYLPMKFAHFGYLDYQDKTNKSNLFYVTKEMCNIYREFSHFPILSFGIPKNLNPDQPIYYFHFPAWMTASQQDLVKIDKADETSDNFEQYSNVSRSADFVLENTPEPTIPLEMDKKIGEMFVEIRKKIESTGRVDAELYGEEEWEIEEESHDVKFIKGILLKIHTIGTLVIKTLMGVDPEMPVNRHILKIYLKTLKQDLTNVYPFSNLIMGHKFERAVLFKVLSDIFELPCWLKRANGLAWNEVYIPPEPDQREMKSNYLIDLMGSEPLLVPVDSKAYNDYARKLD